MLSMYFKSTSPSSSSTSPPSSPRFWPFLLDLDLISNMRSSTSPPSSPRFLAPPPRSRSHLKYALILFFIFYTLRLDPSSSSQSNPAAVFEAKKGAAILLWQRHGDRRRRHSNTVVPPRRGKPQRRPSLGHTRCCSPVLPTQLTVCPHS